MKVGIASCYYNRNYGSMLQAYATQRIIEKMGNEAITIQCLSPIRYMTQPKWKYYFHKVCNIDILSSKFRKYKGHRRAKKNKEYSNNIAIRNEKFDNFYKRYIRLSELNQTREELTQFASCLDAVVVGSDMLWHPVNIEHDYYTLTFVPESVKKVAYATSFGTTIIPKYQRKKTKNFLERFDAISVREESGITVIKELGVDKKTEVVLDPTLLFTADEWMDIQDEKPIICEEYIFCYFLGVNLEHRRLANELKKKTNLKIVTLPYLDEYVQGDEDFGDFQLFDVGPSEFVNLIRNAKYVLTDSFHGTCFSILNHKQFLTFNRFRAGNSQSTNTRIDSLLGELHLEERRVSEGQNNVINIINKTIDYNNVDEKLEKLREESCSYLKLAMEKNDRY